MISAIIHGLHPLRTWFPPIGRFGRLLGIAFTASLAVIWLMFGLIVYDAYLEAWHKSEMIAADVAALIARDIERNVTLYDLSLRGVVAALSDPSIAELPPDLRRRVIFDETSRTTDFGSMLVLDANGNIVSESFSADPHRQNLADRDYFQIHRDGLHKGLFVSHPFKSRLTGAWVVVLSRRISRHDGSFGGVAVGTIRVKYFTDLLATVHLPEESSATLLYQDGTVLARVPDPGPFIGTSSTKWAAMTAADEGEFVTRSRIDNKERIFFFRKIAGIPIFPNIGLSTERLLRSFWRRTLATGIGFLILSAMIYALAFVLGRELHRRNIAEQSLRDLADRDALTGLKNRRSFEDELRRAFRRAALVGQPLSLLAIDVDHFKAYNDRYGHGAGDRALKTIAQALENGLVRKADLVARVGGEEFVALLFDTKAGEAVRVAERIRSAVEDLRLVHEASPTGTVTISTGVASAEPQVEEISAAELLDRADAALYRAKAKGRNLVETGGLA